MSVKARATTSEDWIAEKLCCPRWLAKTGVELRIIRDAEHYVRADYDERYPIVDGVLDLRLTQGGSEFGANRFEVVHTLQESPEEARHLGPEIFAERLGISAEQITNKVVLLAGAGLGNELRAICQFAPRFVVSIDFSNFIHRLYAKREQFGPAALFFQADILNLPFRSNSFDLVINAGVMQCVRSPELGFRELHRVTRPDGVISIGSIYPPHQENRLISCARLKGLYHLMPPEQALAALKRLFRHRRAFEALGLERLHYWLCGRMPLGNRDHSPDVRFGTVIDHYLPEYRHVIHPREVRQWFRDVDIEPTLPKNFQRFFDDTSDSDFGSPTQTAGVKRLATGEPRKN